MKTRAFVLQLLGVLVVTAMLVVCGGEQDVEASSASGAGGNDGTVLFDLGPVADFEFLDQSGAPFTREHLDGKVWVVDFIFTHCAGPCPRMTQDMKRMSQVLKDHEDVRFLSISVDPERDTPEVLAKYAEDFGIDTSRWSLITGDRAMTYQLAEGSFYLPIEDPTDTDQVIHSTRFVVLDQKGSVRAYHDLQTDSDPLLGVQRSVEILLGVHEGS